MTKTGSTNTLSAKLGLAPKVSRPSDAVQLRGAPLPMPGSHAALRRRLFGKKDRHAHPR
jgi:hypothetical protein